MMPLGVRHSELDRLEFNKTLNFTAIRTAVRMMRAAGVTYRTP